MTEPDAGEQITELMARLGGVATRHDLVRASSRAQVDAALARGDLVADARGRYALPVADEAVRLAHALSGVLSLTSAALHHGWEVLHVPDQPHVLLPRKRKLRPDRRGFHLHRGDLHPDDVDGVATSIELTLTQCFRHLPYADALAVGDSALRHGVAPATLRRVAASARGAGSPRVRRVAANADGRAANPFESGLRSLAHDVPGLAVEPQRLVLTPWSTVRPDLVDEDLRIVLEADSFTWHGGRESLRRDAHRYNLLVCDGWIVLRFAWEDVMHDPAYVRQVLVAAVALRGGPGRTEPRAGRAAAA